MKRGRKKRERQKRAEPFTDRKKQQLQTYIASIRIPQDSDKH